MTHTDDPAEILRVFHSKEETKAFYDKIARVYDLLAERSERPMREAGLRLLAAAPGEHVLEIGFGTGHCLVDLAHAVGPSGKVLGIDLSDGMCKLARTLVADEGVADRVELTCGDAEHMPYESDSLDAVFMSFTLELFDTPDMPEVLAECRRVLRPGGRVCVVGVSKEGSRGVVKVYEWSHRHFPNLVDCRPIHVARSLEDAGFTVRETEIEHMWVPVEIVLATAP
jgi:demethylmenaquinone methyltransferase/2-methoxy-6-polyprenyl-1,4-benzoquinol methylase